MTQTTANTWIGVLGFIVVGLIVAIIAILCVNPADTVVSPYRVSDNAMAIENTRDYGSRGFDSYAVTNAVYLENSPVSPEAAY